MSAPRSHWPVDRVLKTLATNSNCKTIGKQANLLVFRSAYKNPMAKRKLSVSDLAFCELRFLFQENTGT